jgi:hypothetical protein
MSPTANLDSICRIRSEPSEARVREFAACIIQSIARANRDPEGILRAVTKWCPVLDTSWTDTESTLRTVLEMNIGLSEENVYSVLSSALGRRVPMDPASVANTLESFRDRPVFLNSISPILKSYLQARQLGNPTSEIAAKIAEILRLA